MTAFILMGVSGSGKSTIGQCVGDQLGIPFIEGDDYHPAANVQKMAGGTPLNDSDRISWIDALMTAANERSEENVLIACSALTELVRTKIKTQSRRPVCFIHLTANPILISKRLERRGRHFMKPGMLPSQLATLQPTPEAVAIDTTPGLEEICRTVRALVESRSTQ